MGVKQLRRRTGGWQRGMEKKKESIEVRVKKTMGEFSIHTEGLTHTYTHTWKHTCMHRNILCSCTHLHGHLCTQKICTTYIHVIQTDMLMHKHIHMNILQPGTEERAEGVKRTSWTKRQTERKSPDSNTIWALGSSNKLTLGHHGDTTNRMKHSEGWPSCCLLRFCLWPPVSRVS